MVENGGGADLERCHVIGAVREAHGRARGFSIANDLARLEAALADIADPALVIIDPITAYLGGTDSYKNADVRAVLALLADLEARVGAAVVAVSHLRKSNEGAAILSVSGSLAFVAASRAAYLVIRDREAVGRNLLLSAKNNLGDDNTEYDFRIAGAELPGGITTSRVVWEPDAVTISADEALATHGGERQPRKADIAADWLRAELAAGPVASEEVQAAAKAAGLSLATLRRAANDIEIIVRIWAHPLRFFISPRTEPQAG